MIMRGCDNHRLENGPAKVLLHELHFHVQDLAVSDQYASLWQEIHNAVELELVSGFDVKDLADDAEVAVVHAEKAGLVGAVEPWDVQHTNFAAVVAEKLAFIRVPAFFLALLVDLFVWVLQRSPQDQIFQPLAHPLHLVRFI